MTDAEINKLAQLMGARVVGKLPDVSHGATGAAHLGTFYQLRLAELHAQEQGKATVAGPGNPASAGSSPTAAALQAVTEKELAAAVAEAEKAVGRLMTAVTKARQLLGLFKEPDLAACPVLDSSGISSQTG